MKQITIGIALLFWSVLIRAQSAMPEAVATAGDFFSSTSGQLSWTLGELAVETFAGGSNTLTQGFQQGGLTVTGIGTQEIVSGVSVYPNPAFDILNLTFNNNVSGEVKVEVYDMTGNMVYTEIFSVFGKESNVKLNFSDYPAGMYLLKFSSPYILVPQTIKIHKTN